MGLDNLFCPVCRESCSSFDVVDFNKSCTGQLGFAGVPVRYVICDSCRFCFAPELHAWSLEEFEARIYNEQYVAVDPDYLDTRPRANAAALRAMFPGPDEAITHLDYGGGNGLLARLLCNENWDSSTYDPFVHKGVSVDVLGKFNLITAFEVFEHAPDIDKLIADLRAVLAPDSLILFSTLLSDGNIDTSRRLSWWYASPRNGHISLFSRKSLEILAEKNNWTFSSFSPGYHAFSGSVPPWATHIIRTG